MGLLHLFPLVTPPGRAAGEDGFPPSPANFILTILFRFFGAGGRRRRLLGMDARPLGLIIAHRLAHGAGLLRVRGLGRVRLADVVRRVSGLAQIRGAHRGCGQKERHTGDNHCCQNSHLQPPLQVLQTGAKPRNLTIAQTTFPLNKKTRLGQEAGLVLWKIKSGGVLLSHAAAPAVSSAAKGKTRRVRDGIGCDVIKCSAATTPLYLLLPKISQNLTGQTSNKRNISYRNSF